MAFTYILLTANGSYYVGSTENLQERLRTHGRGGVKTTKSKLPVSLVYVEEFATRAEAQKKEYVIKGWKSKKLIRSLVEKSRHRLLFVAPSSNG